MHDVDLSSLAPESTELKVEPTQPSDKTSSGQSAKQPVPHKQSNLEQPDSGRWVRHANTIILMGAALHDRSSGET